MTKPPTQQHDNTQRMPGPPPSSPPPTTPPPVKPMSAGYSITQHMVGLEDSGRPHAPNAKVAP